MLIPPRKHATLERLYTWYGRVALFLSHEPFRRDPFGIMEGAQFLGYPFFGRGTATAAALLLPCAVRRCGGTTPTGRRGGRRWSR